MFLTKRQRNPWFGHTLKPRTVTDDVVWMSDVDRTITQRFTPLRRFKHFNRVEISTQHGECKLNTDKWLKAKAPRSRPRSQFRPVYIWVTLYVVTLFCLGEAIGLLRTWLPTVPASATVQLYRNHCQTMTPRCRCTRCAFNAMHIYIYIYTVTALKCRIVS